ncbi:MAG TPA: hypothetical protein VLS48_00655 [Anaerolineales bacterium]|nr:hypothetical protein [Anaerolineales bacterium]
MHKNFLLAASIGIALLLLSACAGGASSGGERTAIPVFPRATPPPLPQNAGWTQRASAPHCVSNPVDLLGAWVEAGAPEDEPFPFRDDSGEACRGTYTDDVRFILDQSNLWFEGAISCIACHGPDLPASYAALNLSDYAGILAGSRRASPEAQGNDILGPVWEESILHRVLVTRFMPLGRPSTSPEKGPPMPLGVPEASLTQ